MEWGPPFTTLSTRIIFFLERIVSPGPQWILCYFTLGVNYHPDYNNYTKSSTNCYKLPCVKKRIGYRDVYQYTNNFKVNGRRNDSADGSIAVLVEVGLLVASTALGFGSTKSSKVFTMLSQLLLTIPLILSVSGFNRSPMEPSCEILSSMPLVTLRNNG